MILINPKSSNPFNEFKAIEAPIWCAMLAKEGDRVVDLEVKNRIRYIPTDELLIVVAYKRTEDEWR